MLISRIKNSVYRSLRWSERYTKTDMIYLAKGGGWTIFSRVVGTTAGLGLTIAFAHLLPPAAFGTYKFLLSLAAIIGAFSLTGMGAAVTRAVAAGYEGTVQRAVQENIRWSWGMVLLALAAAGYYLFNDNTTLAAALFVIAITLPVINSFDLFGPFLKGRKDFRSSTIYAFPRQTLPPVILIAALFFTDDPLIIVSLYFVSQAAVIVGTYFVTFAKHERNEKVDHRALRFSRHLSVMEVLQRCSGALDKILLFHFLGAAPVAVYAFATAPVREIRKLQQSFLAPAFPKMAQRSLNELQQSLPYRIGLLLLLLIPLVGAYYLAAPVIYGTLFPQYTDAVVYSRVFALSIFFFPVPLLIQSLTAHLKKRELYIVKIVTPTARIVLLLVFTPLYGVWGAIIALLATRAVEAATVGWLFWHATDEEVGELRT